MGRSGKNGAIPDGWRIARLGDVATLRQSQQDSDTDNDLPYVGLKHIANGGTLIGTGAAGDYISLKTRFEAGDTLFGKLRPNLRKVVRVPFNGMSSTEILAIVARSPVDKNFLSYVLRSAPMHNYTMQGITGTKMPRTSWSHMKNYGFLLPPLREQRAIAAVLDSIDETIERTETVIAATEQLRDSLLHELLTHGVPGWHTKWKEAPGVGTIPADWKVVRLGDVLETTTYGTNVSLDGGGRVPILRMNNLQDGEIDLTEVRSADLANEDLGKLSLVPGDILFNRTNSLDLVGKVAVVRDLPQPISFASYLVRLRVYRNRVDPFWLSSLLGFPGCQSRIRRFATRGVSQANINPTSLKSLLIPLPSLLEQQASAAILDGVDDAIRRAREERNRMQSLKASNAEALLTGRVRTSGPCRS